MYLVCNVVQSDRIDRDTCMDFCDSAHHCTYSSISKDSRLSFLKSLPAQKQQMLKVSYWYMSVRLIESGYVMQR